MTLVFPGVSQQQAAALYAFAAELKSAGAAGESYWVSFFADGSGDLRVRPQVAISARAEAIARWAPLAARIIEPLDNVRIDEDFVAYDMFMPDRRKAPKGTAP